VGLQAQARRSLIAVPGWGVPALNAVDDQLVERFGDAPEAALREQVATALVSKGVALGRLRQAEEEVAVNDQVVKRLGEARDPHSASMWRSRGRLARDCDHLTTSPRMTYQAKVGCLIESSRYQRC